MRAEIVRAWQDILAQDGFATYHTATGFGGCLYAIDGKHCVVGHLLKNRGVSVSTLEKLGGSVAPALHSLQTQNLNLPCVELWDNARLLSASQVIHDFAADKAHRHCLTVREALTMQAAHPEDIARSPVTQEAFDILQEALDA